MRRGERGIKTLLSSKSGFCHLNLRSVDTTVTSVALFTVNTVVRHTCTCDVNRETVFFVLYRQETMLRCCGGAGNGDGRSRCSGFAAGCRCASGCGGGGQRRRRRARWIRARQWRLSGVSSTVGASEDDGRPPPKYSRVSGRTISSSVDDRRDDDDGNDVVVAAVDERRPSSAVFGLTDCWRRALKLSTGGGGDGSSASDAVGNEDSGGTTTPPARIRGPAPPAAVSNWTMISNSSLKDVDGDDLRDELVGYGDVAATTAANDVRWTLDGDEDGGGGGGGDTVHIVDECYYWLKDFRG